MRTAKTRTASPLAGPAQKAQAENKPGAAIALDNKTPIPIAKRLFRKTTVSQNPVSTIWLFIRNS